MSPEIRELLRLTLLQLAAATGANGQTTAMYHLGVRTRGIVATSTVTADELQYLADKSFLVPIGKAISPELKRWRITAEGRDHLATEGLE